MRKTCFQISSNLPLSCLNHPLQKASEIGIFPKVPINLPRKKNQEVTKITIQAAKRNQTPQINISKGIRSKAQSCLGVSPCFFPSPSYKMHEKVCSFHKK